MASKKQNKDLIQIFFSPSSVLFPQCWAATWSQKSYELCICEENSKAVHGIGLDRKPGSSCSGTLAMQPSCFPQQKGMTSRKWTVLLSQCSPRSSSTPHHTHRELQYPFQSSHPLLFRFLVLSEKLIVEKWSRVGGVGGGEMSSKGQWELIARIKLCALTSFMIFPLRWFTSVGFLKAAL